MKIRQITLTGANNKTDPGDLKKIQEEFPDLSIEWGILLSRANEGKHPRFPSLKWIEEAQLVTELNLSGHLCGAWVTELMAGKFSFLLEHPWLWWRFDRIQINFHGEHHKVSNNFYGELVKDSDKQYILQVDKASNEVLHKCLKRGLDAVPLLDTSHGTGVEPNYWPEPIDDVYCGYAGGLGPDNLSEQLKKLNEVVGDREIWIDMESRVRSSDDKLFDLDKVRKCLETVNGT